MWQWQRWDFVNRLEQDRFFICLRISKALLWRKVTKISRLAKLNGNFQLGSITLPLQTNGADLKKGNWEDGWKARKVFCRMSGASLRNSARKATAGGMFLRKGQLCFLSLPGWQQQGWATHSFSSTKMPQIRLKWWFKPSPDRIWGRQIQGFGVYKGRRRNNN